MNVNKVETIPAGKTLYHGTKYKLSTGYPTGEGGVWFSTSPVQSILHVASKVGFDGDPMYMYIYKVKTPLKVIKFESGKNMNNWAVRSGFSIPNNTKTFAFSNKDYQLAKYLCQKGEYDGWSFPADQSQVMVCRPLDKLNFIKVMEISFPYGKPSGINWVKGNNRGQYIVNEKGRPYKYKLTNIKLNNLKNITNVPKNAVYSATAPPNYKFIFFDSTGKRLNITRENLYSRNGFVLNGKRYYGSGQGGSIIRNHEEVLKNRVRSKNESINVNKLYWNRYGILTQNQKNNQNRINAQLQPLLIKYRKNFNEWQDNKQRRLNAGESYENIEKSKPVRPQRSNFKPQLQGPLPLPKPRKTMNNININAGSLFPQAPPVTPQRRTMRNRLRALRNRFRRRR